MTTFSRKNSWKAPKPSPKVSKGDTAQKGDTGDGVHFETAAIHLGLNYQEGTGAIIPPVYLTSTFRAGNPEEFDYTRSGNPNFTNLEETLSALEGAQFATVFSSGVAATTAVISTLKSGDLILTEENIYGCTYRLFDKVFEKFGLRVEYLDFTKDENIALIREKKPTLVWLESPTNPLLKILDIERITKVADEVGSTVLVDNTFASSFFQRPVQLGAHLSLSSTTKYTNGHSDCLGGVVCTNSSDWQAKMIFAQKSLGLNPSPLDAWLIARGAKTLAIRMERHEKNALAIAEYLESFPYTKFVRYPFLRSHPQYEVARKQMYGGSGIVTVDFDLSLEETKAFLGNLKIFALAESLGGIESLICHPATMTHASVPKDVREKVGITDSLVRFSVGIEHIGDLIADIEQAFLKVKKDAEFVSHDSSF